MNEQLIQLTGSLAYNQATTLNGEWQKEIAGSLSADQAFDSADLTAMWADVCTALESELGDKLAIRWLKRIAPHHVADEELHLSVPSPCILELVKRNYADQILSFWQGRDKAFGRRITCSIAWTDTYSTKYL